METKALMLLMCMGLGAAAPAWPSRTKRSASPRPRGVRGDHGRAGQGHPGQDPCERRGDRGVPVDPQGRTSASARITARGSSAGATAKTATWTAPAFLSLTGGSFGLQIGGQSLDLVLVVMNKNGLDSLMKSEFKIGGGRVGGRGPGRPQR